MQINNNTPSYNQNFGSFMPLSADTKRVLAKRLNVAEIEQLKHIITKHNIRNQNTNICLHNIGDSSRLIANVYPENIEKTNIPVTFLQYKESLLYKIKNPIKFIKKVCQNADIMSQNIKEAENKQKAIDSIL